MYCKCHKKASILVYLFKLEMKRFFMTAFLAVGLLVSANAQDKKPAVKLPAYYSPEFLDELKATPEQKAAINKLMDDFKAESKKVRANSALTDEEKKTEIKRLTKERTTAYYKVLNAEQNEYVKEKRKQLAAEAAQMN